MGNRLSFVLLTTLAAGACSNAEPAPEPPKPPPAAPLKAAAPETAADVFKGRCTPCHGATGKGDGAAAAALNPKPRDYTSAEWQASVTDEQLEKIIVAGGPAVGKSAMMPANPDLANKPEIVKGLVQIIRDFGPK